MTITVQCQHCFKGFTAETTSVVENCPHCSQETYVTAPRKVTREERAEIHFNWKAFWLVTGGLLAVIGLITWLGISIYRDPALLGKIGEGGVSAVVVVLGCILAVITFILTAMWTFFPWFVYFKLNRLNALLEKIEENTRK